ncbi:MAG: fumarylacetoacetate hydrolase family protein [Deltaproteobacteria bacterium]|nr:fumarylacetoacetate hydrolase family protein [Deltaproteobacteria bacterium]
MKLVTFVPRTGDAASRIGALVDDVTVVDLQRACELQHGGPRPHFQDMLALLDGGTAAMDESRALVERARMDLEAARVPLATVRLLAPVPRPRSIRDCMAFEQHVTQATRTVVSWAFPPLAWLDAAVERVVGRPLIGPPRVWYERPVYYKSNPFSVVGPEAEVRRPRGSRKLDYELEFGVYIGRAGRDITEGDARLHVAGFTVFNDFSARDIQMREMRGRLGPAKGKDFDTGNAMGPWLVTPDEVGDPYALSMVARVNGEERSRGSSATMHHRFERLIAYVSQDETLHPGEFLGSGTVGGGCGLETDRYLADGDVVELEVERLGVLRNRVAPSAA